MDKGIPKNGYKMDGILHIMRISHHGLRASCGVSSIFRGIPPSTEKLLQSFLKDIIYKKYLLILTSVGCAVPMLECNTSVKFVQGCMIPGL